MKTDWLATAQASQSKDFRDKNPHLFGAPAAPVDAPPALKKAGKRRKEMNKTESKFSALMDARVARGEIESFEYEGLTLRWPDGMRYTPDFAVYGFTHLVRRNQIGWVFDSGDRPCSAITLIEVKGAHSWAKDVVKFRAARDKWGCRYRFEFWQELNGEWRETR